MPWILDSMLAVPVRAFGAPEEGMGKPASGAGDSLLANGYLIYRSREPEQDPNLEIVRAFPSAGMGRSSLRGCGAAGAIGGSARPGGELRRPWGDFMIWRRTRARMTYPDSGFPRELPWTWTYNSGSNVI